MASYQTVLSVAARAARAVFAVSIACAVAIIGGQTRPARIISLVPNVTEILFAIGAGPRVVAVSTYDDVPPEVAKLPRVGALLDPNVERILSLKPDLVVVYGSQADLQQQLERASIPMFSYRHAGLANVTATMRALGKTTGDVAQAERVAAALERQLDGVRQRVAGLARPKTLIVFGRDTEALRNINVSGAVGFLHDVLELVGGQNVVDVKKESVQLSLESILALKPEAIIELRYTGELPPAAVERAVTDWNALASVPAVRNRRVHVLVGDEFVVPGPRIGAAAERMARALHPDSFK